MECRGGDPRQEDTGHPREPVTHDERGGTGSSEREEPSAEVLDSAAGVGVSVGQEQHPREAEARPQHLGGSPSPRGRSFGGVKQHVQERTRDEGLEDREPGGLGAGQQPVSEPEPDHRGETHQGQHEGGAASAIAGSRDQPEGEADREAVGDDRHREGGAGSARAVRGGEPDPVEGGVHEQREQRRPQRDVPGGATPGPDALEQVREDDAEQGGEQGHGSGVMHRLRYDQEEDEARDRAEDEPVQERRPERTGQPAGQDRAGAERQDRQRGESGPGGHRGNLARGGCDKMQSSCGFGGASPPTRPAPLGSEPAQTTAKTWTPAPTHGML